MGRPSTYTDDLFNEICERMANGETLMQICRDDQMPDHETVKRWTRNVTAGAVCTIRHGEDGMDGDEAPQYARARARRSTLN